MLCLCIGAYGIHVLEDLRRQKGDSFDQFAAPVDHPQTSVRPVGHLHRPETGVARGQESVRRGHDEIRAAGWNFGSDCFRGGSGTAGYADWIFDSQA